MSNRSGRHPRRAFAMLALCGLLAAGVAVATVPVPPPTGRVVDLTGTLSGATVARVERQLAAFDARQHARLAVLMVATTRPENIADFAVRVADAWKLDRPGVGDGAILIIAKNDHRVRIEVGSGLEGALSDALATRIVMDTIAPHFHAGDFDGGVEAGVSRMIAVIDGEPLPPPDRRWTIGRERGPRGLLPLLMIVVLIGAGVLHALIGRLPGSIAAGGLVGALAWSSSHRLLVGVGAGVLAFGYALLLGGGSGWSNGGGWRGRGGIGGGDGPFGGRGPGGGGIGGGFGNAGGEAGGGGASGNW